MADSPNEVDADVDADEDDAIEESGSRFGKILMEHIHKLCSMHEITPFIMMVVSGFRGAVHKEKGKYLEQHGEVVKEEGDTKHYVVPLTHTGQMKVINRRLQRSATAYETLPPSFVVALVSEYDAFLGQLISEFLRVKPELLNSSEKNISFSELQEFGSIDAARERLVEKEVETVLRKSHSEQFSWLEKKVGVELRKGLNSWPAFIEITERRNLFVHCDGVVSSQYLQVCRDNGVVIPEHVVLGHRLGATREYIRKAYECLYEISVKLTHVVWRRLLPDELNKSDSSMINITYELLEEKQNRLASKLLAFSVDVLKKWGSEANRRVFIINYAQSFYHRGEKDKAVEILDREDWSACSDDFRMCERVLREDYEDAFALMRGMGKDGPIDESLYMDWPVFRELRKHSDFPAVYEEVFGKPPVDHEKIESEIVEALEASADDDSGDSVH